MYSTHAHKIHYNTVLYMRFRGKLTYRNGMNFEDPYGRVNPVYSKQNNLIG